MLKYCFLSSAFSVIVMLFLGSKPASRAEDGVMLEKRFYTAPTITPASIAVLAEAKIVRGNDEVTIHYLGVPCFLAGHYRGWYECARAASNGQFHDNGRLVSESAVFVTREELLGFQEGWKSCFAFLETTKKENPKMSSIESGELIINGLISPNELYSIKFEPEAPSRKPTSNEPKRRSDRQNDPFGDFFDAEKR